MTRHDFGELTRRLGEQAEAVCRHYLSNGRRHGGYWLVGDVKNNPGRSMFVRLRDSPKGRAGKWLDAATGDHGDLLDVIREVRGLVDFGDVLREARNFLGLAQPVWAQQRPSRENAPKGSAEAARRLWAISNPIAGTIAETYLRQRGLTDCHAIKPLRFHPRCYYRSDDFSPSETWPAMIAAVTNCAGEITGVQRTWLARDGFGNHRHMTAAMIDSREFLSAKKRAEQEVLLPAGPKIAFSGGEAGDHRLIWAKLDQVHAKHLDMVLLHGGSAKGAEKIAARWADHRKVPQIAFKPDWSKHAKAAPFKRNDQMLAVLPIGVIVYPGTGIQDNLADKARKMGIPVYRF